MAENIRDNDRKRSPHISNVGSREDESSCEAALNSKRKGEAIADYLTLRRERG